ncbi:class I SAM-dependent methyltransferase [Pseudorhodoplanes sp.]|uniref:class I SAM-dependent methyltransferase n=1 Tax=Pseudorhodoplanes sp. TaxID=1934341 RepID=UPI002BCD96EB|nr:class I SAM-dependent methyltransferase [Pseudorhodoplanes sp.]HWV43445.1 class I SAM-dependent methyltransferase [Pseudorhodoplanes sp.]
MPALGDSKQNEVCGDGKMSAGDRVCYLWQNLWRNLATLGRGPAARSFAPDMARARAEMSGQSPSRLITNVFIDTELPNLMPPRQLDVLEVGCGAGAMASRLAVLGYSGSYTGVDIQDYFKRERGADFPFTIDFHRADAHTFTPQRPIDLMISVSTLEHIPSDAKLIARFPGFFKPGGVEVHILPAGASLLPYLWHGYRQYTPAKLAGRFGPDIELVRIGGLGSLLLHTLVITAPEMFLRRSPRRAWPGVYEKMMWLALRLDRVLPVCPTAYAVIRKH